MTDLKDVMKYDGPGIWFSIHVMTLTSTTPQLATAAAYYIRQIVTRLRGTGCRRNAIDYIKSDPPNDHLDQLFEWTVHFHNSVNRRLGKKLWTVERARRYYTNPPQPGHSKCKK